MNNVLLHPCPTQKMASSSDQSIICVSSPLNPIRSSLWWAKYKKQRADNYQQMIVSNEKRKKIEFIVHEPLSEFVRGRGGRNACDKNIINTIVNEV